MLNLLNKSSFDISLLFKLKYAAISLILWTVNKPCYNDSFCLHEYTKMIGLKRKRHLFGAKKSESTFDISSKMSVNKTFTHVQEQKKVKSPQHSAYILSSVKSPLLKKSLTVNFILCAV